MILKLISYLNFIKNTSINVFRILEKLISNWYHQNMYYKSTLILHSYPSTLQDWIKYVLLYTILYYLGTRIFLNFNKNKNVDIMYTVVNGVIARVVFYIILYNF